MNLSIYIEDSLASKVNRIAKQLHKSRNSVIREAIREWVAHRNNKKWPKSILTFEGEPDLTPFESLRNELKPPKDDPLS